MMNQGSILFQLSYPALSRPLSDLYLMVAIHLNISMLVNIKKHKQFMFLIA